VRAVVFIFAGAIACAALAVPAAPAAAEETSGRMMMESKRPPRARIANALAKHLRKGLAKTLLTPETCKVLHANKQTVTMRCHKRGCDGCMVTEASAELRFEPKGVTSIHNVATKYLGETGQCGHCFSRE
jgi:hypothetical protein